MSSLGILSGPRSGALGEEKMYTTAGREYWIDLFDQRGEAIAQPIDQRAYFTDWVTRTNEAFPGSVQVLVIESGTDGGWLSGKSWDWVKFRTNMSVPWTPISMGIPTAIKPGEKINTRNDATVRKEESDEQMSEWASYAKWGLIIAGLAVGAHLLGSAAKISEVVKGSGS